MLKKFVERISFIVVLLSIIDIYLISKLSVLIKRFPNITDKEFYNTLFILQYNSGAEYGVSDFVNPLENLKFTRYYAIIRLISFICIIAADYFKRNLSEENCIIFHRFAIAVFVILLPVEAKLLVDIFQFNLVTADLMYGMLWWQGVSLFILLLQVGELYSEAKKLCKQKIS